MKGKRIALLIFTILWYLATVSMIIAFVTGLIEGEAADDFFGYFLVYFILSMILCGWQMAIIWIFGKMYDYETYQFGGRSTNLIGLIFVFIFAPVLLIRHLFVTLKPLWILLRYDPDDYYE